MTGSSFRKRALTANGSTWKEVLTIYSKEPGSRSFRFHDLRHTFASWYMMNVGDLYELAKILGHSNIKMTERYVKLAKQHIATTSNTAREMWKLLEPLCDKANVG